LKITGIRKVEGGKSREVDGNENNHHLGQCPLIFVETAV
jgi:hypothetical protein